MPIFTQTLALIGSHDMLRIFPIILLLTFTSCLDDFASGTVDDCDEKCTVYYSVQRELNESFGTQNPIYPNKDLQLEHVEEVENGFNIDSWFHIVDDFNDSSKFTFTCFVDYNNEKIKYDVHQLQYNFPNERENFPEKIRTLPKGMEVSHSKREVFAEINEDDPEKYGQYKWHFATSVSCIYPELVITEFGAYQWTGDEWEFKSIYDRAFNPEEFSEWYSCPEAIIVREETYTDSNNWSKGNVLSGERSKSLWYFIGQDGHENNYVGWSEIITVGKVSEN
jgi:hypothetical protein